jgi:hypothetical protein
MQNRTISQVIAVFLFSISAASFANPYDYKVTRVIDGDTVEFVADFLPDPLTNQKSEYSCPWCRYARKRSSCIM